MPPPQSHLIPPREQGSTHPHPWLPTRIPGREAAGCCAAAHNTTQASPARPVLLCRIPRGWHAPSAALHDGAASRRPGAQPRLCPPPRAAPAAAAGPLRARERVSSKRERASAAVPDSSARCGRTQMPGPPPRLRQRSMQASPTPAPAQACRAGLLGSSWSKTTDLPDTITSGCPLVLISRDSSPPWQAERVSLTCRKRCLEAEHHFTRTFYPEATSPFLFFE